VWRTWATFFLSPDAGFVASGCLRRRGGIGRRAGLKIQWPRGRVGSSPSAGISVGTLAVERWTFDV